MKTLFVILSILIFSACTKSTEQALVKGKVVYTSCATIVVEVLDSAHHNLAQESWQQGAGKPTFRNVFTVANKCSFPASVTEDEVFYFQVVESDPKNKECVTCALFDNPPSKKQLIKVTSLN